MGTAVRETPGPGGVGAGGPVVQQRGRLLLGFQSKSLAELEDIFTETAEAQELASGIGDAAEARQWLRTKLQAVGEKAGFPGVLGEAPGRAGCIFPWPVPGPQSGRWICSAQPSGTPHHPLRHHPLPPPWLSDPSAAAALRAGAS